MKRIHLEQGTDAWRSWRLQGIGGSDAPAVLGRSPYVTRAQLLEEKVTGVERESTFEMRRGTRLEPIARSLYAERLALSVEPVCVVHDEVEWLYASLDGLAEFFPGEPTHIAEIKCWREENHRLVLNGIVPDEVLPQIQHQLLVTGLQRCDLVSYTDHSKFSDVERLAVLTVEADAEAQAELLEAEEAFWAEVVAGRKAVRA